MLLALLRGYIEFGPKPLQDPVSYDKMRTGGVENGTRRGERTWS